MKNSTNLKELRDSIEVEMKKPFKDRKDFNGLIPVKLSEVRWDEPASIWAKELRITPTIIKE